MKRPIPFYLALAPLVITIVVLVLLIFVFKLPAFIGLLTGALTALLVARFHGYSIQELFKAAFKGMKNTSPVVIILLVIGALVPVWMASGTVPGLIYYGLSLVNPKLLLPSAFLLTAGTSLILGTSVGTLSTMGIALMGIGFSLGLPVALVGGAVVSGALFGERCSPMSSAANMAASAVDLDFHKMLRYTLTTGIPGFILVLAGYWFLQLNFHSTAQAINSQLPPTLATHFHISWLVLIPPALVMITAALKVPTKYSLMFGALAGGLVAVFAQNISIIEVLKIMLTGYHSHTGTVIDSVLKGGGIVSMLSLELIILSAGVLNGITSAAGMLQQVAEKMVAKIKSPPALVLTTILFSTAVALVACNQTLPILMPGQLFQPLYDKRGVGREILARTLTDSGLVISALIPWNLLAILCSTSIGVPTLAYAPYALLLWIQPVLTIIFVNFTWRQNSKLINSAN